MRKFLWVIAPVLALAAACSSSDSAAPGGSSPSTLPDGGTATSPDGSTTPTKAPSNLPCDVDAILAQNCQSCHSSPPQYGAPMSLMTWDDLQAAPPSGSYPHVYQAVAARVADDAKPMPPSPNARLSAADQKTLTDYATANAPKTTCATTTSPDGGDPGDPVLGLSCTPDKTFAPASPYAMPATPGDQYVCWGVDVTATTPTHLVGFAPKIDNTAITHHLVMYEANESYSSTPTPCDAGAALSWRAVYAWAPGVKALELPPQAGFPVSSSGTHYVVQMHYSNPQGLAGQTDATSFGVCSSPPRQYEADVLAFGTQDINIQPGEALTQNCKITVSDQFAGIHLFTALPHMHRLGISMATTLTPANNGPNVDLGTIKNFDFNTQAWLPIDATTASGDTITTQCQWKNTTGATVTFGETTADEMCYSFTMYYPRIQSQVWSWATPALISNCN